MCVYLCIRVYVHPKGRVRRNWFRDLEFPTDSRTTLCSLLCSLPRYVVSCTKKEKEWGEGKGTRGSGPTRPNLNLLRMGPSSPPSRLWHDRTTPSTTSHQLTHTSTWVVRTGVGEDQVHTGVHLAVVQRTQKRSKVNVKTEIKIRGYR